MKVFKPGSQFETFLLLLMVSVPPYCGVPSLSHQLPVADVVVTTVVGEEDAVVIEVVLVVKVEDVVELEVGTDVDVDVDDVDCEQEASKVAIIIKKLNPNHMPLIFNF